MTRPAIAWLIGDLCIGCRALVDQHTPLTGAGGLERLHCPTCGCGECGEGAP